MAKRLHEYVKYTTKELDLYTETEGSCVTKINTNLHLSMGPFCLADFKHALMAHLIRDKVGFYDILLDGIVLDVKNIKVLPTTGVLRGDDARIHVDINADVYVFKPEEGAVMTGVVKHIGPHQVGVILYRVFNANLRVERKIDKEEVKMDQEVKFRIRNYNLQNVFPYIDGELLTPKSEKYLSKKKIKQEDNADSGIDEKDGAHELDNLLSLIKSENTSDDVDAESNQNMSKKSKKAKGSSKNSTISESSAEKTPKKSKKLTNSIKSTSSASPETTNNIDNDLTNSDDNTLPPKAKKIKQEEEKSFSKQVHIKEESESDN